MMAITMEDLNELEDYCNFLGDAKIIHFKDVYIEPKMISSAISILKNKVHMATIGIDQLDDADQMLLYLIQEQKGYCY